MLLKQGSKLYLQRYKKLKSFLIKNKFDFKKGENAVACAIRNLKKLSK